MAPPERVAGGFRGRGDGFWWPMENGKGDRMAKIWLGDEETYGLECCFDGKPGSYGETEVSDAELAELATLSAAVDRFYELLREYRDRAKAQKTYARALEVLGSEEAAQAWWTAPHPRARRSWTCRPAIAPWP